MTSRDEAPEGATGEDVGYAELAKIHNVSTLSEATLIKSILESFRIPCDLPDDVDATVGTLSGAHLHGIDIMVPAPLAQRASAILCERGVKCEVDPDHLARLIKELHDLDTSAEARERFLAALEAEESKDVRRTALKVVAAHGDAGLRVAMDLIARSAALEAEEAHVVGDIAQLVQDGAFGDTAVPRSKLVGELSRLGASKDARVRRRAAMALGKVKRHGACAPLVSLLEDADEGVRDEALESLYHLSGGESHGFDPAGTQANRDAAVARWRVWQAANPGA